MSTRRDGAAFDSCGKFCASVRFACARASRAGAGEVRRIWRMTYEYAEVTGPRANLETNPCFGPFPYRYSWNVYIWQKVRTVLSLPGGLWAHCKSAATRRFAWMDVERLMTRLHHGLFICARV